MKTWIAALIVASSWLAACDRVGSEAWCEKMNAKPGGEWTLDQTGDYTKYCVLGMDDEKWCKKLDEKPKGEWTADEAARYAQGCLVGRTD